MRRYSQVFTIAGTSMRSFILWNKTKAKTINNLNTRVLRLSCKVIEKIVAFLYQMFKEFSVKLTLYIVYFKKYILKKKKKHTFFF